MEDPTVSEDAHASNVAAPITQEMLESLAADYKAGRLPDDVKERLETLRDEYAENFQDRFADLKGDLKPSIDEFVNDLRTQMRDYEAEGGSVNSEVADSRMVPVVANAVDGFADKVLEPMIDAVEDVVHDAYDVASELVQLRADHDPDGIYAEKLAAAQEELDRAGDAFDTEMDTFHGKMDTLHDDMEQLRVDAEEFHQEHAPVQMIHSTTVDPNLPDQMAEAIDEGSA
jgi:nucleotide-binding universal stress UspA family protein